MRTTTQSRNASAQTFVGYRPKPAERTQMIDGADVYFMKTHKRRKADGYPAIYLVRDGRHALVSQSRLRASQEHVAGDKEALFESLLREEISRPVIDGQPAVRGGVHVSRIELASGRAVAGIVQIAWPESRTRRLILGTVSETLGCNMYPTPAGDRTLTGAEARLFIESLAVLVDLLTDGDCAFGIEPFDNLQRNQQIAVLHKVGHALLRPDVPGPALTASIEAAVAAVYTQVVDMIRSEIDDPANLTQPSWRHLVLQACQETEVLDESPNANSTNTDEWSFLVNCLEGLVLWDNDWELEAPLDADPQTGEQVKRELGIADDYYVAIPPDPTDVEAEQLLVELRELTAAAR